MNRRYFLSSLAAPPPSWAAPRSAIRIIKITLCPIDGRFHKFVTMNSQAARPNGHTYVNTLIRVLTDQGMEGIGVGDYSVPDDAFLQAARALIGTNPLDIYEMKNGRITRRSPALAAFLGKYAYMDGPLFDLVGKATGSPCWKLLGDAVRQAVTVYDGTIYISDIWFQDRGVRAVIEEVEESAQKGYTGMKLKVGRGFRWMDKNTGIERDLEVLRAARKAVGPNTRIMADDNNAYDKDFDRAWKFLRQTQDVRLHWIEEIFPETVADYTRLKELMAKAGMQTLIADGENMRETQEFEPYLKPRRLMDVVQLDIRRGGFLKCRQLAGMAEAVGGVAMPHNWGSQIGVLMALQLSKACKGAAGAEDDRSTCDVIIADGYTFKNGTYSVPDAPGMNIRVDEKLYRERYQSKETVVT
jgi:L-alanine-DL-glutamate epimerase-like enolase superfamily enzyme